MLLNKNEASRVFSPWASFMFINTKHELKIRIKKHPYFLLDLKQ